MKTKILFILLLIAQINAVVARSYTITGNTKTKTSYILHLIKKCNRTENTDLTQCLLNSQLFSHVDVKNFNDKTLIEVKERWTLIPIPQIKVSSNSSSYGGYLVERNFLGKGKLAVIGGSLGSESNNYMLFYKDKDLFYSDWIFEILSSKSDTDQKAYNENNVQYGFKENETLFKSGLGYRIIPEIEAGLSLIYQDLKYSVLDNFIVPTSYHSYFYEIELKYQNSNYKFYFNEGIESAFVFAKQFARSDSNNNITKDIFNLKYQKNIWLKHALQLGMNILVISDSSSKDLEKIGAIPSFRGIPEGGLWVEQTLSFSCDYQIPVSFANYGTWTIAPFADYGIYESTYTQRRNFSSYGIGGYLYLKEIAMPGIGIIWGTNNHFEENFVSFSVGIGRGH
ncbi:MAG: hypothetical protein A2381_02040 [Bdellovibrionales bacterium RIFOXYB1_FULL_37_110]|nr:MAG: hypothetical protein A2417_13345 [Bdellovibrionales bacterium RIFOXYC1_FULL_37_79]OFZ59220.1 MAG: hypothetical protein A2381_02040 [Bdellovibrionales bacterium RIFOXYB1_FULL_37_110]OFZ62846.1 MAG: hypothetical protein A2577_10995 [Bdellovibrionales bacterium RIFOXYD1_FULL_36_51]